MWTFAFLPRGIRSYYVKKQFTERKARYSPYLLATRDLRTQRRWYATYFASRTKLESAIRVVTYGRFDFTADLRLPRSNASPKKGHGEKRNIVATFPHRKTYGWSEKNAPSTRWQYYCSQIVERTLHVLIVKADLQNRHWNAFKQLHMQCTHVITISRPNSILPLPIHVANATTFIFSLINFTDSLVCALLPLWRVNTNVDVSKWNNKS